MMITVATEETCEFLVKAFDLPIRLWMLAGGKADVNIQGLTKADQRREVNCGPWSETMSSGRP